MGGFVTKEVVASPEEGYTDTKEEIWKENVQNGNEPSKDLSNWEAFLKIDHAVKK